MLLRSNLISKFKSSLLTIPLSWLAERTFENSNRLFRSLIISKSCLYEYSFPWISEYNFSIIADFSFFKSSMILFWVAIRSSSKSKSADILFISLFPFGKKNSKEDKSEDVIWFILAPKFSETCEEYRLVFSNWWTKWFLSERNTIINAPNVWLASVSCNIAFFPIRRALPFLAHTSKSSFLVISFSFTFLLTLTISL